MERDFLEYLQRELEQVGELYPVTAHEASLLSREMRAHEEKVIRTTLQMASDRLRERIAEFKTMHPDIYALKHDWCEGVLAAANEIDPRLDNDEESE